MAKSMKQMLNPNNEPLTKEQTEILETFSEVEKEMIALDRLALLLEDGVENALRKH